MATLLRRPTGDGSVNNWTANGATGKWECVDEASADDDTTYISRADSFANQYLTFAAFAITSSAVASITVYTRARADGGANQVFTAGLNVGNNLATDLYFGTPRQQSVTLNFTYSDFTDVWLTNPDTGLAWTEADVEGTGSNPLSAIICRASGMTAGDAIRVTQVAIEVDYTAAAAGISIPVVYHHRQRNF